MAIIEPGVTKTPREKAEEILAGNLALLDYANEVTGAEDTRLGDAVRTLAEGYGSGGGLEPYYSQDSDITTDLTSGGTQDIRINRLPTVGAPTLMAVTYLGFPPVDNAVVAGGFMIQYNGNNKYTNYTNYTKLANGTSLGASSSYGIRFFQFSEYNKNLSVRFQGSATYPIYTGTYRICYYDLSDLFGG